MYLKFRWERRLLVKEIPSHKLAGKDPGVVWYHVAARSEGSEADELYGRLWNIMDQGAEAGGTDVSGMNSCSIGAGDRNGSGKLDGSEKIGEGVGD